MRETSLSAQHLVLPVFVQEGSDKRTPIGAMPGCYRLSIDHLLATAKGTLFYFPFHFISFFHLFIFTLTAVVDCVY